MITDVHLPRPTLTDVEQEELSAPLRAFIRDTCFIPAAHEPTWSNNGERLGWLFDLRPLLLHPHHLWDICVLLWQRLPSIQDQPFQLAGREMSAIPLLVGLQLYGRSLGYTVNALIVRRKRKRSGRLRQIEGTLLPYPVIVVDDLINSGQSIFDVASLLKHHGLKVTGVLSILDFDSAGTRQRFERRQLTLDRVFTLSAIDAALVLPRNMARPKLWPKLWHTRWSEQDSWHITPKSTPVADAKSIYFGTDTGFLLALRQQDGRVMWRALIDPDTSKGVWSSPALHRGRLYFGAYDGGLYCFEAESGTCVWHSCHADYIGSSPLLLATLNLVLCGTEYARSEQRGGLCAFSLTDGAVLWEIPSADFVHGSPVALDDGQRVVVGTNAGDLLCIDALTGTIVWQRGLEGAIKSRVTATGNYLLVGTFANSIYCLDTSNGQVRWRIRTRGVVYSTPLVINGYGYIGCSDKYLYVVSLETGALMHKHKTNGRIFSSPRRIGDRVLFGTTSGWVYELDPARQKLLRRARVPGRITNDIVLGNNGIVFVGCDSNAIYAFDANAILESAQAPTDLRR